MRISDLPVSVPVGPARTAAKRPEGGATAPTVVTSEKTDSASHPDEVAAAALQKAAATAHATRVVSAENQRASESVRGDIDPARLVGV